MKGERLDQRVFALGLAQSRERARALIMAGQIYVDGQRADKAGMAVAADAQVELRGDTLAYVSRGGLKLEKALQCFPLDLQGKVCMDVGASTGGFTDCMLQNGAAKVYAVDVGYGQLAWKLRCDERVINRERCNFRYFTAEQVPDPIAFFSVDVSFISLKHMLPVMRRLAGKGGEAVCLVKPQFEAGREKVGKKGVVREKATHIEVIQAAAAHARENGFRPAGLEFSPITGPEGNIEFLLYLRDENPAGEGLLPEAVEAVVDEAHAALAR